eukprot:scaffold83655_cov36-Cyclotella_meneghiniana.AAC.1
MKERNSGEFWGILKESNLTFASSGRRKVTVFLRTKGRESYVGRRKVRELQEFRGIPKKFGS